MHNGLLVALLCSAVSCQEPEQLVRSRVNTISVIDDNGRDVVLQGSANRVISLVPAATEIIRVLDREQVLVARTNEVDETQDSSLQLVGTVLEPSIERIVELQPDLVIAWADADVVLRRLAKAGIHTYGARFERINAIGSHVRRIGTLLGVPARADSVAKAMAVELDSVRRRFRAFSPPAVLYLLETDPVWTAGRNTFIDDMVRLAGGRNVFGDLRSQWSTVALEAVVQRQPDVMIVALPAARANERQWLQQPGWRDLQAVQESRVYFVDADQFHRPGPGIVTNVRRLAHLLHSRSN